MFCETQLGEATCLAFEKNNDDDFAAFYKLAPARLKKGKNRLKITRYVFFKIFWILKCILPSWAAFYTLPTCKGWKVNIGGLPILWFDGKCLFSDIFNWKKYSKKLQQNFKFKGKRGWGRLVCPVWNHSENSQNMVCILYNIPLWKPSIRIEASFTYLLIQHWHSIFCGLNCQ